MAKSQNNPEAYTPRTTVLSDGALPVRYTETSDDDATLAAAIRVEVLRDTYFGDKN